MKNLRLFSARILASLLLGTATFPANAASDTSEPWFEVASVSNQELSQIRGGFIDVGGIKVDFALASRTYINGDLLSDLSVRSSDVNETDVQNLHQFIQVGGSNQFSSVDEILNSAGLVTVVQNSLDNTVIQNLSELDIVIENFSDYQSNLPLSNALQSMNGGLR